MKAGLIGLGRMGRPIAWHLMAAGYPLAVFDVDAAAMAGLADAGALVCATPAAVAASCDVVFICVPGPRLAAVLEGPDSVFPALGSRHVIVEMSVTGAEQGRLLARQAEDLGARFLDAPISGGEGAAIDGKLTALVGGDAAALARVEPLLRAFCSNVFHLGGPGAGYLAKALNQIIYLSYVASFCEAAALGERAGIDVPVLLQALKVSVAGQPLMTGWDKRIASPGLPPGFQVHRVVEDLAAGAEACEAQAFDAPIFREVLKTFQSLAAHGRANDDMTSLYLEKAAGRL